MSTLQTIATVIAHLRALSCCLIKSCQKKNLFLFIPMMQNLGFSLLDLLRPLAWELEGPALCTLLDRELGCCSWDLLKPLVYICL